MDFRGKVECFLKNLLRWLNILNYNCDSGHLGLKNWLWSRRDQHYWGIIWEVSSHSQYTEFEVVVQSRKRLYLVLTTQLCNVKDSPRWYQFRRHAGIIKNSWGLPLWNAMKQNAMKRFFFWRSNLGAVKTPAWDVTTRDSIRCGGRYPKHRRITVWVWMEEQEKRSCQGPLEIRKSFYTVEFWFYLDVNAIITWFSSLGIRR